MEAKMDCFLPVIWRRFRFFIVMRITEPIHDIIECSITTGSP